MARKKTPVGGKAYAPPKRREVFVPLTLRERRGVANALKPIIVEPFNVDGASPNAEKSYLAPETVDHPAHYNSHPAGIECIDVVEHMPFNVGNAVKYLWRADHKGGLEDLRKAAWYVAREIERREKMAK